MNNNSDFLKIIGLFTMLIDHIGAVFYPQVTLFRIIGRIAFPIFAYQIGVGYKNTKNLRKYLLRLLLVGIISQVPYSLLFTTKTLNIFFTLLIGLIAITVYERINPALGMLFPFLSLFIDFDYGIYGVFTILVLFVFNQRNTMFIAGQGLLNITYCLWYNSFLQMYSILAVFLILYFKINIRINVSKLWFYAFYPVHLIILLLLNSNIFL
ncbi:MAG: hypothetical protein GX923_09865 [Clostridia bacterium]|nr:hypothetical protein [Clostridia bacterium]